MWICKEKCKEYGSVKRRNKLFFELLIMVLCIRYCCFFVVICVVIKKEIVCYCVGDCKKIFILKNSLFEMYLMLLKKLLRIEVCKGV